MNDERQIDGITGRAVQLLKLLVTFDSTSRNSNLPIIDFIKKHLQDHRVFCTAIPSADGSKSNLLARIGPEVADGVILSGHTDVVPVDGQEWSSDPFTLTERDGRLYGRGAADMKGFLAICLAMLPEFSRLQLQRPIWLAFSYDEEIGCLGAPVLLEHITKNIPKPAFAVIGEPTRMQVVTAHKGVLSFETSVRGMEWHSSQPHMGVNAVQVACELVQYLTAMAAVLATSGLQDARFDPPCSTVHTGIIQGGTARNIVPRECRFQWEIRPLPNEDGDTLFSRFEQRCREVEATMRKTAPDAVIATRPISHMPGVTLPAEAQHAAQTVMRWANTNEECAVSFGTEAGVFNDYGVPAIICGPGSIEQAHKPDEFIEHEQLRECAAFMLRLIADPLLVRM